MATATAVVTLPIDYLDIEMQDLQVESSNMNTDNHVFTT